MANREFYDSHQAEMYLSRSVIRLENEPIYISSVGGDMVCRYIPLKKIQSDSKSIHVADPALDFTPVPLGNVDFSRKGTDIYNTYHAMRFPRRMWKVGLSKNNLSLRSVPHGDAGSGDSLTSNSGAAAFARTIKGEYKTFEEARDMANKYGGNSVPFSRRFSCGWDNVIFYKRNRDPVGTVVNNIPTLNDEYQYLQHVLEEDLNV